MIHGSATKLHEMPFDLHGSKRRCARAGSEHSLAQCVYLNAILVVDQLVCHVVQEFMGNNLVARIVGRKLGHMISAGLIPSQELQQASRIIKDLWSIVLNRVTENNKGRRAASSRHVQSHWSRKAWQGISIGQEYFPSSTVRNGCAKGCALQTKTDRISQL